MAEIINGRQNSESDEISQMHSPSIFDFIVKDEPLYEENLISLQKDRIKKDTHNLSKYCFGMTNVTAVYKK